MMDVYKKIPISSPTPLDSNVVCMAASVLALIAVEPLMRPTDCAITCCATSNIAIQIFMVFHVQFFIFSCFYHSDDLSEVYSIVLPFQEYPFYMLNIQLLLLKI